MDFTNYTIIPSNKSVNIDGNSAFDIDMTGVPSNVSAVQWYGNRNYGVTEFDVNADTGELPPPEEFTNPLLYKDQLEQAEKKLFVRYFDPYYSEDQNQQITLFCEKFETEPFPLSFAEGTLMFEQAKMGYYGPVVSYSNSHWYSTVNGNEWKGQTYNITDVMVSPTGEQPPNSTNIVPIAP